MWLNMEEIPVKIAIPGFIVLCLIFLAILGSPCLDIEQSKDEKDLESIITSSGNFFRENRELFLKWFSLSKDVPVERVSFILIVYL